MPPVPPPKSTVSADLDHLYRVDYLDGSHIGSFDYYYTDALKKQAVHYVVLAHRDDDYYSAGIWNRRRQTSEYVESRHYLTVRNLGLYRFYWQHLEQPARTASLLLLARLLTTT